MKLSIALLLGATVSVEGSLRGTTAEAPPHKLLYHLEAHSRLNPICYETTYTDAYYQSEGFRTGRCDESFDTVVGKDIVEVCEGHSEVNIKDCTTKVIKIEVDKLGKSSDTDGPPPPPHKPFYHLEQKLSNTCFETTYIDEHYTENGFVLGACDETYNRVISKDDEEVCNKHSEVNVKNCPTEVIDIEILKLGKKTDDDSAADTTQAPPHKPFYHLEAKLENVCYETTYMDQHYQENGFVLGACDDTYTIVVSKDTEDVCDGHSEVNVKNCPTSVVEIEILKLGKQGEEQEEEATQAPPHKPFYHVEAKLENVCYETTYTDAHYQENGFVLGACDENYNTVVSKDTEQVCDGHSEVNVKNCPTSVVDIEILKLGKAEAEQEVTTAAHKPLFHLEAKLEAVCYETTYTDAHYQENGFVLGACDETYNTVVSKDEEQVCNGHSEVNVKDCTTGLVNVEILKLGKASDEAIPYYHVEAAMEDTCYETKYIDDHYKENGFVIGACDLDYNIVDSKDTETVCDQHSEMNEKDCPTSMIEIIVLKMGKKASEVVATPNPVPVYHLEAKLEAVCYETTYTDDHYRENGFVLGRCDETYNTVESKDIEEVCNGHSEVNVKNCPTEVVQIDILKLGKTGSN